MGPTLRQAENVVVWMQPYRGTGSNLELNGYLCKTQWTGKVHRDR